MMLYLMKYKLLLLMLLLILVGVGAFFLGQLQAGEEPAQPKITQAANQPAATQPAYEAQEPLRGQTPEETIARSENKAEQDLARMQQNIEANNQQAEDEYQSGKRKIAAPQFKTSDIPTREVHFQN